jgi:SAM-dependent methyltransferase
MSFDVAASAYDRFIGRYSLELAPRFLDFAGIPRGPVIDVGCGPGSLTRVLADRFGAASVLAVDLSEPFVAACRARVPGADVRRASAEALPVGDGQLEGALSQLVLSFLRDAPRAAAEMARVVRPGGCVAACTFAADGFALAQTFWRAALRLDPAAPDDARLPLRREAELRALWEQVGLREVEVAAIDLVAAYTGFEDFWTPFLAGIGPAAGYLMAQPPERQAALRERCLEELGRPGGPFTLAARVLAVRGRR